MDASALLMVLLGAVVLTATLVTFIERDLPRLRGRVAEVFIVERWPDTPGHPGGTKTLRADRKAISTDGRWWLVRERGIFTRYRWRPVKGAFVRLYERGE